MKNKDIEPRNTKGVPHGYQELCLENGKIWVRGIWKNGLRVGYIEYHVIKKKIYHIR